MSSRVLKTRGETGVQCSGVTRAQRCHGCRSSDGGSCEIRNADPKRHDPEEDDRAASAQLCWMKLKICKGTALNFVVLAGDCEGLEAW